MDLVRLALVRAGNAEGAWQRGSGYLVGPQLVLTARHVVADTDGRWWPRVQVYVGHPERGPSPQQRKAEVCWPDSEARTPEPQAPDVALLWLDEPVPIENRAPVRWGQVDGIQPLPYHAFGFPLFAQNEDTDNPAVEHLRGELAPASTDGNKSWVLDARVWPGQHGELERPWSGASGSAVFCYDRLVAVVTMDKRAMGWRRLYGYPAHLLFTDPVFVNRLTHHGDQGLPDVEQVLAEDGPAAATVNVPELPPLPDPDEGFTGRADELQQLTTLLHPANQDSGSAVLVASVFGMGGIGKTTLALAAGHTLLEQGAFTGALFIDLHGYTDPVSPEAALDTLLRMLGVPAEQIPPTIDERAALYRAQLAIRARHGQRILVLADNVGDIAQAEHLRPSRQSGHRLLVTSRDDLSNTGWRRYDLDTLGQEGAEAVLQAAVHAVLPKDTRIAADPKGTANLGRACGGLPLALRIAAAQLTASQSLTPTALAEELAEISERLDALDDGHRSVRVVIERSVRRLPAPHQELLTLLAVEAGPDISTAAATALAGVGKQKDVRRRLTDLCKASLLIENANTGRWSMHDLVRAYATERAHTRANSTARARQRLLEHYTKTAYAAAAHLSPTEPKSAMLAFRDRAEALVWLDAEHSNLVAAVHSAHAHGLLGIAIVLPSLLGDYLDLRHYTDDLLAVTRLGLEVAQTLNDPPSEAVAWGNLGVALREVRRFDEAITACTNARDLFHALGDTHGEAAAWDNLGNALTEVRRFDEAITACTNARDLFHAVGDAHREAMAWSNLGVALTEVRRFDEAITACTNARDLHHTLGDTHREAMAWNNLGTALREARRFDEAITAHTAARDLHQTLGDTHQEAMAWNNLGTALREARRFDEAITACTNARDLHQTLGDTHHEALAWNNLGGALTEVRRFDEAITACTNARDLLHTLGDAHGEAMAWSNLGVALSEVGRFDEAVTACTNARDLLHTVGDTHREAMAWNNLGTALREVQRFDEAITAHTAARDLFHTLGDTHHEAMAWSNLGGALTEVGRFDEAVTACTNARDLHQTLGDTHHEAMAWSNLGGALTEVGRFDEAITACTNARDLHQTLGDTHREAMAWGNLGFALTEVERFDEAVTACTNARDLLHTVGDAHGEAMAWNNLGVALRGLEYWEAAVEAGTTAVELIAMDAYREGGALGELAETLRAAGRPTEQVRKALQASADAYQRAEAEEEAAQALKKIEEL
ncbi:tetratricopeptide repeat protein [Actinacidiphila glaucinigra]|uniref:tetratricopeptide repeat protein n=1 Tax=Actinacidiphila glaucinigra TaxID=235986 RepID=UPI0033DE9447